MRLQVPEIVEEELKSVIMQPGSLIKGTVLDIKKDWIVVDTHLKTESMIPREQFKSKNGETEVHIGDEIELMLEIVENGFGKTQVSYEKAQFMKKWLSLETAFKEGKIISGLIKNKVRGGFTADLEGIQAFLPSSLVDLGEPMDFSLLENTETTFKIIKIDRPRLNIVVSHKATTEGQTPNQKREYFELLAKKGVVRGTVKRIVDYGAFIDLGKGEGLLYIGDIAWYRIKHPSDILKIGEQYDFKIINYDKEKNHLSLSLREMMENPWQSLEEKFTVNQIIEGTVTSVTDYGLFVEVASKIEGLVHLSELDWINKSPRAANYAKVGDRINVMVLKIDKAKCRLALGYKQCHKNPWQEFADKHAKGDIIDAKIKEIYDYGIFVEVAKNIDGFIHVNNLGWDIPGTELIKQYNKGQVIQAMITFISIEEEKVSLSIKKMQPNYIEDFIKEHPVKKSKVKCIVTAIEKRRVLVDISENVQGIIPAWELSGDRLREPADLVKIGEELEALILKFDKAKKIITLSPKAIEKKQETEVLSSHRKKGGFFATLGDILHLRNAEEQAEQANEEKTNGADIEENIAAEKTNGADIEENIAAEKTNGADIEENIAAEKTNDADIEENIAANEEKKETVTKGIQKKNSEETNKGAHAKENSEEKVAETKDDLAQEASSPTDKKEKDTEKEGA